MTGKKRAVFYVDGFNMYHALDGLNQPHLKWLSLTALADLIKLQNSEAVAAVNYYSAIAGHIPRAAQIRHTTYVSALRATGVRVILGKFRDKPMECRKCHATWTAHEEKQTDVNIAVRLVRDALLDAFDVAYIISGDTDLLPAVRTIKADAPKKEIVAVLPPFRRHGTALMDAAHRKIHLNASHINKCLLPATITAGDGSTILRPTNYVPPI